MKSLESIPSKRRLAIRGGDVYVGSSSAFVSGSSGFYFCARRQGQPNCHSTTFHRTSANNLRSFSVGGENMEHGLEWILRIQPFAVSLGSEERAASSQDHTWQFQRACFRGPYHFSFWRVYSAASNLQRLQGASGSAFWRNHSNRYRYCCH